MPPKQHSLPSRPARIQDFHDLMRHRTMDVLLVCNRYDLFLLEEAGQIAERLFGEYRNLDLHYAPGLTGVETGAEALGLLRKYRFDIVISSIRVGDMSVAELARAIREEGLATPVVVLAYDQRELMEFAARNDSSGVKKMFLWQGDARILVAIIKCIEDEANVAHDTGELGVQVILLVEDNVRFYSSFLPAIYTELLRQSQRLISEGENVSQKITRMRARPKILHSSSYEEAWAAFSRYSEHTLGVISDVEFPKEGRREARAGLELARRVRELCPDVPVLLQSTRPENAELARNVGAAFLLKGSPVLLQELRRFMLEDFGFGDFCFRTPDGGVVDRAADLRSLEEKLHTVPDESIVYHSERNHFSRWLKARTEFALAHGLRPRKVTDFASVGALRHDLIDSIAKYRQDRLQAIVADFDAASFDPSVDFCRIGGGSLGGKARGLAFARLLLEERGLREAFRGTVVAVPPAAVVATDVFERFLDEGTLRDFAMESTDDLEIRRRFAAAVLPDDVRRDLAAYLATVRHPIAVRSSSLLEDSQYQPFAGVYDTIMLPNDHPDPEARLLRLERAIKAVYASTFVARAKRHLAATSYRLEEEKMAVILQSLVGTRHGSRFYPDFSGVARSHNFYAVAPFHSADGVVAVALGLGRMVVDGGICLRFCPKYPQHIVQFASVADTLASTQREFLALELPGAAGDAEAREVSLGLEAAEQDGTLAVVASTYSPENDAIHDGTSRRGLRLVTFAPVLKQGLFPLADIVVALMAAATEGIGRPVEIEFAVGLSRDPRRKHSFGLLQMRPLALARGTEEIEIGEAEASLTLCRSSRVLGNGRLEGIRNLVVVPPHRFERARNGEAAQEIDRLNRALVAAGVPYVLIGVGRWGSADPRLGIPVAWEQISGAKVIVEAGLADMHVAPSDGTHFFQNLTAMSTGYFTVAPGVERDWLDWDWLARLPAESDQRGVRHLVTPAPLVVLMDGRRGEGVILRG
jgi:CheY-like chemotaxis protein